MTAEQAIRDVISTAESQVGYREEANNRTKYAAELDPLKITFGSKQGQPWCAEFVLWVFYKCFGVDNALALLCSPRPTGIPLCADGAMYFERAGRWSDTPSLGAVVFFFGEDGIGHQGIVTDMDKNRIRTVEGNCGDMVARRSYSLSDKQIAGYGWPKWSVVSSDGGGDAPAASQKPQTPSYRYPSHLYDVEINLLQNGSYGPQVVNLQHLLADHGFDPGEIDGIFGDRTRSALQAFQRAAGIDADGVWGGESFRAMWNWPD